MKHWIKRLQEMSACREAMCWADNFDTIEMAWAACERGDWMLWLLGKCSGDSSGSDSRKKLVLTACECARLALPFVTKGETRPLKAIETAEAWARGDGVSLEDVTKAAAAAYAAYAAADDAILKQCADIVRKYYPKAPRIRRK